MQAGKPMFDAYVAFQAKLRPTAFALITPQRWATYAEINADVDRMAAGLAARDVHRGRGVVSIRIANDYLAHVVFLALARLGVVSSPFDDPSPDLAIVARDAGDPGELALSDDALAAIFDAEPRPVTPVRVGPDERVRVMLSSGTTRTARRVPRTWRMLEGNTRTCALTYCAGKPGRWACLTGMDTGQGQAMTLAAWSQGEALVADFTAAQIAASLEALRPSILGLTPAFLRQVLALLPPGFPVQSAMRVVSSGGLLSPPLARETRLRLAPEILISYGAAETGSSTLGDGAQLETLRGSVGYAVPNVRIDIVDEQGAPLAVGEAGEVRVVSDRASDGYLGDPEATARAFRDGAFYSGDLGRLTADGALVIEGRLDDRLDLGGVKFLPELMEEVALTVPGVIDAAAYAAPDDTGTDICWLAVQAAVNLDRAALARLLAADDRLPDVRFAWIDAIPRNAMGKVERRQLRAQTIAVLAAR